MGNKNIRLNNFGFFWQRRGLEMNGSPKFVLEIEERAGTAIARSEQGVVGVVLFDSTKDTEKHVYASRGDVLQTDWDNDNYNLLKDLAFVGSPYKIIVRRVKEDARDSVKITDILSDLENDVDSIVIPKATESETDDLISYAKVGIIQNLVNWL